MIRREIHPEVKVSDERTGTIEYIASDESLDAQQEAIRADGYRFDRFVKNAPLLDSHRMCTIGALLGKVISFRVEARRLINVVQWAIDVPECELAQIGYNMTAKGYLKAVSVGFIPDILMTLLPQDDWPEDWGAARVLPAQSRPGKPIWQQQLTDMGFASGRTPQTIYVQQQQIELSACVIGANANALAKAYKAGIIDDSGIEMISTERTKRESASVAKESAAATQARQQKRQKFLDEFEKITRRM